ncbi:MULTISPECIES: ABC transporter permease [unclassified Ensifer]|uniref:ABC transporter permease n=1 Tax=unclassified Ensifer TaxID=2633371 RepID=UPI00081366D0|nr:MULTISPECIES: ABC transporter permease [unclassified Ensifer]OCP24788.1 ABC transporter permease [Ensifer sp. LC54]OCP25873.1 ABC transporter permease [Ensifer sp. LC384]OCP36043.1 ABC transporter permease [Ensifer sp. LC163]
MDFTFLWETFLHLLSGVPLTLNLALVSTALGAMLAVLLTAMRMSALPPLGWASQFYVFVFRGTPLLVQMFVIYYGLGQFRPVLQSWGLWAFFREPYWCAIFALSLNTAAYASEILRGGLQAVPHQQVEAARASGMWGFLLYRRIILPIAMRQALPAYGSEIILMVKATSLASVITMLEVTGLAAKLISQSYRAVEVFVVAGIIYLALNFAITRLVAFIEWWMSPHLRPVQTASSGAALQHA